MPDRRLAKVVNRSPDKIAQNITQPFRAAPAAMRLKRKRLRAHHDSIREALVIDLILLPLIVVAAHVEMQKSRIIRLPLWQVVIVRAWHGHGDWSRCVNALHRIVEFAGDGNTRWIVALIEFIADAPKEDAGMVPVPHQHGLEVALPPVLEVDVIIIDVLNLLPT